jgi:uncharacterized OB-fold protein
VPRLTALATHLPLWGGKRGRVAGPDEDALTLAIAAGRAAMGAAPGTTVHSVVLVTRDVPVLQGGIEAVLLAGLGLPDSALCSIVLGGAPAALDAVAAADDGVLVLAADVEPSAASAAALLGPEGSEVTALRRAERSLPVRVRDARGGVAEYDDPRLQRVRGTAASLARLELQDKPVAVAGVAAKEAAGLAQGSAAPLPTEGAAAALFALADVLQRRADGTVVAVEQATASAVVLHPGSTAVVVHAPPPRALPTTRAAPGGDIKISLPAYDRAFDSKVGLQAGRCASCGTLALPPRLRCLQCGSEQPHELVPLPREATVYTAVTVHVPVPGLISPYQLAVVELGDTDVRLLSPVTDAPDGEVAIGGAGTMVLRRQAVRAGVPDYGYSFQPVAAAPSTQGDQA